MRWLVDVYLRRHETVTKSDMFGKAKRRLYEAAKLQNLVHGGFIMPFSGLLRLQPRAC